MTTSSIVNFERFLEFSGLEEKEHQREGVTWCINREENSEFCRGGIIADEMGLGKTITMIATMIVNFKMPNLIVLPVALIEQWKEQIQKTTGHTPLVYHGQVKRILTPEQLQYVPIVLTTYGTVNADAKQNKTLQKVTWSRLICDEAHHLRNKRSKIVKSISSLQRSITWLISGTPIQNHINDLYSLFDVLKISNKVYTDIEKLRNIINAIILKRTKEQAGIQLPELTVKRINGCWTNKSEKQLSMDIHDKLAFSNLTHKPLPRGMTLAFMSYARMMCVYPNMIVSHIHKLREMGAITDENIHGIDSHSKINDVVDTIVKRKNNENRKIVFTNFSIEATYLAEKLLSEGMDVALLDGRVTSKAKRQSILKRPVDVLILQIKTGNEGLNLQMYNEVYFVTPQWNPKIEEQAIARCHRMGQTKPVYVFRFVMDSFDEGSNTSNIEMYTETIQSTKNEIENKTLNCIEENNPTAAIASRAATTYSPSAAYA
jgi:SNF2 family DNA or RNA helicase